MRIALIVAVFAPLVPGCSSSEDTRVAEVTVLDHLTPCISFQVQACMLIDEGSGPRPLYDGIAGFTYHWGSTYRLEVDIVTIHDPPPDGSSRELRLREVIEAAPVAPRSEFALALPGNASPGAPPLLTAEGQGFAMPLGRQIACDDPAVCTSLADALGQPAAFDLTLRHPDHPGDETVPLTAVAVVRR